MELRNSLMHQWAPPLLISVHFPFYLRFDFSWNHPDIKVAYRKNDRMVIESTELADLIWKRVQTFCGYKEDEDNNRAADENTGKSAIDITIQKGDTLSKLVRNRFIGINFVLLFLLFFINYRLFSWDVEVDYGHLIPFIPTLDFVNICPEDSL